MARHEVMRNFEEIRKKSAKVREDKEVQHIWKQGFPVGTDYDQAISEATKTARSQEHLEGQVLSADIIQTPEHEANGEFLVSLIFAKGVVVNGPTDH